MLLKLLKIFGMKGVKAIVNVESHDGDMAKNLYLSRYISCVFIK